MAEKQALEALHKFKDKPDQTLEQSTRRVERAFAANGLEVTPAQTQLILEQMQAGHPALPLTGPSWKVPQSVFLQSDDLLQWSVAVFELSHWKPLGGPKKAPQTITRKLIRLPPGLRPADATVADLLGSGNGAQRVVLYLSESERHIAVLGTEELLPQLDAPDSEQGSGKGYPRRLFWSRLRLRGEPSGDQALMWQLLNFRSALVVAPGLERKHRPIFWTEHHYEDKAVLYEAGAKVNERSFPGCDDECVHCMAYGEDGSEIWRYVGK